MVLGLQVSVEAYSDEGGHVDRLAQVGAASADEALAAVLTGVSGDWGETREASGAAVFQLAKLGHLDQHDQGRRFGHAWDADEDIEAGFERSISREEGAQGCIDGCDLSLDLSQALGGLTRAFIYAGARTLLVSQWQIDSRATVRLMTTLFQTHAASLGEAMRDASRTLMASDDQYSHPYYWAAFSVVGDAARPMPAPARGDRP